MDIEVFKVGKDFFVVSISKIELITLIKSDLAHIDITLRFIGS